MPYIHATDPRPLRHQVYTRRTPMFLRTAWLRRFLPAEAASLTFALVCGTLAAMLTGEEAIVAAASAWSAVVGYYTVLFAWELADQLGAAGRSETAMVWPLAHASVRSLLLAFGGAEALDSLLFSPLLLYICIRTLPNLQLAIVMSEFVSGVIFYTIVLVAHQARPSLPFASLLVV